MEQDNETKWRRLTIVVREKIDEILAFADDIHDEICERGSGFDADDLWKIEAGVYGIGRCIRDLTRSLAINGQKED